MDDLSVKVSPRQTKREVTFTVDRQEAARIANALREVLSQTAASQELSHIYAGFKAIADDREFGGH